MMFKKLLCGLSLGLLVSTAASAQTFEMSPNDTLIENTQGPSSISGEGNYLNTVDMSMYVTNLHSSAIRIKWTKISDSTEHPAGWVWAGVCDNINCRSPYDVWYTGAEQTTFPIAVGETNLVQRLMEARVYVPASGDNGTGYFRLKAVAYDTADMNTPLQTDTLVYIINKNPTSITVIDASDKRVKLYPNPAVNAINVFADKNLNAANIVITTITGANVSQTSVAKGAQETTVNIDGLAPGTYMIRVNDVNGKGITNRKFIKK